MSMANLETLELRISANAQEAARGLGTLISSLSALSEALIRPYSDLKDLNDELLKFKRMGHNLRFSITENRNINTVFKTVEKTVQAVTRGKKETVDWAKAIERINGIGAPAKSAKESAAVFMSQPEPPADMSRYKPYPEGWREEVKAADRKRHEERRANWDRMGAEWQQRQQQEAAAQAAAAAAAQNAARARALDAAGMLNESNAAELLKRRIEAMATAFVSNAAAGKLTEDQMANGAMRIQNLYQKYQRLVQVQEEENRAQEEAAKLTTRLHDALERVRGGVSRMTSGISKLFSRVTRIATTMMIRKAIKGLTAAIKEGLTNLYEWSNGVGGAFGKAVTEAKDKVLLLKNSIGAALGPVVQAMIPIFQTLSHVIIEAANWLNQFFALLTGQSSWTHAIEGAQELEESMTGAGKAAKQTLAAFDELNVIGSQDSGGGGTSAGTQTTEMFEQLLTFQDDVKAFVQFIKDNLDAILVVAAGIGTVLLGWKVSEAFNGMLSTLGGILALVGTTTVTIALTWAFTNQYLNTGDEGWLLADALTTALGSTAAWLIAKQLLGSSAASWAPAITLTLSAITGIVATLGDTDVSAVSKESILANLENALKVGVAAGLLMHQAEFTTGQAIGGGAVAALAVFGVAIGIKTMLQASKSDKVTGDDLKGIGLSSLALGVSATLAAKIGVEGISTAAALGFGGAVSGLAALLTAAVVVGIKATTVAKENKAITAEVLGEDALASILAGGAVAIAAGMASAAGMTVLALAGGAALLTFGALVGVQAILTADKQGLKWGDTELTEEEIQAFVDQKMFKINVNATIDRINASVDDVKKAQANVDAALAAVIKESKVLKLGISSESTAASLAQKITGQGGLVEQINNLVAANQNMLKLTFSDITIRDKEGKDITAETLETGITGWDGVQLHINSLGQKISAELSKGYTDGVANFDETLVQTMLGELEQASQALSKAQIVGPELAKFSIDLSQLSEGSAKEVLEKFKDMKSNIESAYRTSLEQSITSLITLSEYYYSTNNPAMAEECKNRAEMIKQNLNNSVEEATNAAAASGAKEIQDWILSSIGDGIDSGMKSENLIAVFGGDLNEMLEGIIANATGDTYILEVADMIGFKGWDLLSQQQQQEMFKAIGGLTNPDAINQLKEKLQVDAADIITISDFATLESNERTKLVTSLINAYGSEDAIKALKEKIPNISAGGIISMTDWDTVTGDARSDLINSLVNAYGAKGIAAIKKGVPNITAEEVVNITKWKSMSDSEQAEFIQNMNKSFGKDATKKALANIGKDVSGEIKNGMDKNKPKVNVGATVSKDTKAELKKDMEGVKPTIKPAISKFKQKKLDEMIKNPIEGVNPTVKVDSKFSKGNKPSDIKEKMEKVTPTVKVDSKFAKGSKPSDIEKQVEDGAKPTIQPAITSFTSNELDDKIKKPIEGVKPDVKADAELKSGVKEQIKADMEGVTPQLKVEAQLTNTQSFVQSLINFIWKAVKSVFPSWLFGGSKGLETPAAADGGVFSSGDIFIANENGKSEMIGRFGNQTGVANQEQMVEAMARGVEYANSEQNALLRRQNELLTAILRKDASVRIGASSMLGRTVRQSLDMYEAAAGV